MSCASTAGHREISDLANHRVPRRLQHRAMVERYVARDGRSRVKGGRDLKGSQAYPKQFLICVSLCLVLFVYLAKM